MPELPEVETVVRQFVPLITGQTLLNIEIFDPKLRLPAPDQLLGRPVERVFRLGKQIVVEFAGPQASYVSVHLRMTGRLKWARSGEMPDPDRLRACFSFGAGHMSFYDVRRFGTIVQTDSLETLQPKGLDPLSATFTSGWLTRQLAGSRQHIKPWLLRQDRLVGLGNIYCSEILFAARVRPEREAKTLNSAEVKRVHRQTVDILQRAIDNCGTTFSDFQDSRGEIGSYQQFLRVYNRGGEPCLDCQAQIRRIVQQQRSTFYCPSCQK